MDKSDWYLIVGLVGTAVSGFTTQILAKLAEWRQKRHKRKAERQAGKPRKGGRHRK